MAKKYDWNDGKGKVHSKPKTPKTPSLMDQATAEMDRKYKPQIDMAQGLLGEAAEQLGSDIETAKNNAAAIHAFAETNKAPTIDRYKAATGQVDQSQANAASALEGTGPSADIFRRAITANQGASRTGLVTAGQRATQELSDRQMSALAGKVAATNQARGDYRKTKGTLTSQIQSLVGQQGADVIARFGQLAEQQAANQTKIDVAKIGADARRDVAGAGATRAADKDAAAAAEKERKRVGGIREASGTLQQSVADAADLWDTYSRTRGRRKNSNPATMERLPYLNAKNEPVATKEEAAVTVPSPDSIRARIQKDNPDVDPGILHIALLRRAKKPLDAQALKYIKANPNWRIPREWLRNQMDQRIHENTAAGPPTPGV